VKKEGKKGNSRHWKEFSEAWAINPVKKTGVQISAAEGEGIGGKEKRRTSSLWKD